MPDRGGAELANAAGHAYLDRGLDEQAEQSYLKAIDLDPEYEHAWFNLGLVYKRRRDWANCARCNLRAAELDSRPEQPAWWNLGIAATALRDWELARRAWTRYGVKLPEGSGPIGGWFGWTPVRLDPGAEAEVVWGRRIDPARVVIENVPFPEVGRRYRDIVLHDGEPKGEREADGRMYHVFDEIELWQASGLPTVVGELICPEEGDAKAAVAICEQAGLKTEDWAGMVR